MHTGLPPLAQVPLFSLVEAFQGVLAKSKIKLSHDVVHERITLTDRINELVDVLRVKRRVQFEDLFTDLSTRFDLVITFLALLEMTKLRMTRLVQEHPLAPIFVEFSAQVNSDDIDENATPEEQAIAQAKADAEADAAADAHAREHAHEPHANTPFRSERVSEPEMTDLPGVAPDPVDEPEERPEPEEQPEIAPELAKEAVTSEETEAPEAAHGAGRAGGARDEDDT